MMGFFSKIFASPNATGHTAVDDAEAARQAQIKKIEALLDSVNTASQHVRNYYITFMLACFYIAMIVWSTTDLMLLKNTPVTMPLLNVNLPITGFYTFAPYFFLLLHFNLLLQFSLLADKVHRFDQAVIELPDSESRRYYYTRLFAFVFTQILSARHHSGLLRFLLTLMVWITAIWLPLGILIGLQVGFLPYHDENILSWQRSAVMLDLLVLLIFWPVIRAPDSRWRSWIKKASELSWLLKLKATMRPVSVPTQESINRNSGYPVLEGGVSFLTSFCVIVFVWGIAVLPDSDHEKKMRDWLQAYAASDWWQSRCKSKETDQHYFIATEWLFDGFHKAPWKQEIKDEKMNEHCKRQYSASMLHRNLVLREQLLIANEVKAEDEADLTSRDETTRHAALKKITPLILSGRDLRYADFSEVRLPKVNLFSANNKPSDLRYANFERAMLIKARMDKVLLKGAELTEAEFQGAELNEAQFQGATLNGAQFQGATLNGAQFQGATLVSADFQGAELMGADFQGATLKGAQFQGAKLAFADFRGAELMMAKFQGADIRVSDFELANILMTKFGFLTQQAVSTLVTEVSKEIPDKALRQRVTDQLTDHVQLQQHLFAATGNNILEFDLIRMTSNDLMLLKSMGGGSSAEFSDPIRTRLFGFWNGLKAASDITDYKKKLAEYLIELSCNDRWVAQGIIWHRIGSSALASIFAQCLLSLKDQKNQADQLVCPAMSEVNQTTLKILQKTATEKNSDVMITPTFACRTKRSDPAQSVN